MKQLLADYQLPSQQQCVLDEVCNQQERCWGALLCKKQKLFLGPSHHIGIVTTQCKAVLPRHTIVTTQGKAFLLWHTIVTTQGKAVLPWYSTVTIQSKAVLPWHTIVTTQGKAVLLWHSIACKFVVQQMKDILASCRPFTNRKCKNIRPHIRSKSINGSHNDRELFVASCNRSDASVNVFLSFHL